MPIYFIQQGDNGPIKIGIANNVRRRFTQIQINSPYKLKLLATIDGNREEEKSLHLRFKEYNLRGEWFEPTKELLQYIFGTEEKLTNPRMIIKLRSFLNRRSEEGQRVTATELAKEIGITRVHLQRIMSNQVKVIKLDIIDKIINAMRKRGFDMQVTDLIDYRED